MLRIVLPPLLFTLLVLSHPASAQKKLSTRKDYLFEIQTEYGKMYMVLSDRTPLHKANFVKLAKDKFFDGLLFHRIIEGFMIQGGDPDSRNAPPTAQLGNGSVGYTIPAEFDTTLFHKKGAVGAARNNNPEKASSGCQFYFVQGKIFPPADLEKQVARAVRKPSAAQLDTYSKIGGSPHLDGNYTVFGEIISGIEVIDSVASQPRNGSDRPLKDIRMKISFKVKSRKKISKKFNYHYL